MTPTSTSPFQTSAPPTSSPVVSSTTTTPPTPTTSPVPTSRAIYPAYLPAGIAPGVLWVYNQSSTDGGYTQSYYGAPNAAGKPAELVIEEKPAGLAATTPAKLAGHDVLIWRSDTSSNPVIGVTAKVAGKDVTLIGYGLSESDLGVVLNGLRPRANGPGWETGVLPAGLRIFGEGDQTSQPSDVRYLLRFGPADRPRVSISVAPGALMPEDTCVCNPGMRRSLKTATINGTPAVVIDRSDVEGVPGAGFEVDWQYAPDIVVGVSVAGLDESEAVRIASSIAAADPATWSGLRCVNAGKAMAACSPEQVVPTSG